MLRRQFQYHPDVGYTYVPGLRTRVEHEEGGYLVRVNQAGFRSSREFSAAKGPGVFRVLLFGDSFAAGDGVSNDHRFGDVLETLVPGLEVCNYGLSGTGTDQQYLAYRHLTQGMEYDLLLIAVMVENIKRVVSRYRTYLGANGEIQIFAKPYFRLAPGGALERHHDPVPRDPLRDSDLPAGERRHVARAETTWWRALLAKRAPGLKALVQKAIGFQPVPGYASPDHPDWRLMRAILAGWIGESKTPVVLCPLPTHNFAEELADPTAYRARFRELAEETGAILHDPLPDYWNVPRRERGALRLRDGHPSRAGHRLLAESLAPAMREQMQRARS